MRGSLTGGLGGEAEGGRQDSIDRQSQCLGGPPMLLFFGGTVRGLTFSEHAGKLEDRSLTSSSPGQPSSR